MAVVETLLQTVVIIDLVCEEVLQASVIETLSSW